MRLAWLGKRGVTGLCKTKPLVSYVDGARVSYMSEWQPIETVPKDGTLVLLHRSDNSMAGYAPSAYPRRRITLGCFFDGYWMDGGAGGHGSGGSDSQYTHWHPIPERPS